MQASKLFVGVDVAKAELVTATHETGVGCVLPNRVSAIDGWLHTLPAGTVIAMESTGSYHRLLAQRAYAAGLTVYVLNARDVYFYAKALGARSKTDRVDARLIARYVAEHHLRLHAWQPGVGSHALVQELMLRRTAVVAKRTALRQTLRGCSELGPALAQLDKSFDALLQALDAQVQALIDADATLSAGQARLRTITGFGPQASALLAALLARMGFANADALVAYSGMDPRANDSGAKCGKRRLSKRGLPALRRQMYLAAFAASHSKALAPLYQATRARGFSTTESLVILARKLLRVAFAVWKTATPFDPRKMVPQHA